MSVRIVQGDCREVLRTLDPDSVDACVTDPPYDLTAVSRNGSARVPGTGPFGRHTLDTKRGGFMGKAWDGTGVAFDPATWKAVYRVLKPGAHLLAFGGTRTWHRLAVAIEGAGFEIRDTLMWLYGTGFPKNKKLGGGWGTALKPAWEPIVVARKPCAGSATANFAQYGTGGYNVDGCRITSAESWRGDDAPSTSLNGFGPGDADGWDGNWTKRSASHTLSRWPANLILDEDAAALLDAEAGERKSGRLVGTYKGGGTKGIYGEYGHADKNYEANTGGPSRFYYCAKASRAERNAGLEGMPERASGLHDDDNYRQPGERKANHTSPMPRANHHPCVKPLALMRYLCRLITPPDGLILDPFMGSGSTGCAAVLEGFAFLGTERDAEYVEIARRRIAHWQGPLFAEIAP